LVGLDGAGKTTLVKRFKMIPEGSYEYFTTTPYINVEKVTLPFNNIPCVVYDLSG
jgi:GTPase SAR1 family protein